MEQEDIDKKFLELTTNVDKLNEMFLKKEEVVNKKEKEEIVKIKSKIEKLKDRLRIIKTQTRQDIECKIVERPLAYTTGAFLGGFIMGFITGRRR